MKLCSTEQKIKNVSKDEWLCLTAIIHEYERAFLSHVIFQLDVEYMMPVSMDSLLMATRTWGSSAYSPLEAGGYYNKVGCKTVNN